MLKPSVEIRNQDGLLIAEFWDCYRLDPAPVLDLKKKYEDHIAAGGRVDIVIDLLGVAVAGSAALGNFLTIHRLARPRGGRLFFCNVDPNVFEVLRVSKIVPLLEFAPDRAAAVALVNAPPPAPGETLPSSPGDPPAGPKPPAAPKSSGNGLLRSSARRKLSEGREDR